MQENMFTKRNGNARICICNILPKDNLNNIRSDTSRHFWNKKRGYLKDKTDELATNSENKNITKDENGDLLADSHNILNRWKN
jgi:hypothetical protein